MNLKCDPPSGERFTSYAPEGRIYGARSIIALLLDAVRHACMMHAWQRRPSASIWKHSGSCVVNGRARGIPIPR
jgi:hypothetical protein